MKRILWIAISVAAGCGLALATMVWFRFHPAHSIEWHSSNGHHRLLAVAVDSPDETLLVKACDWPHALLAPFVLGDAAWPEIQISAACHWSTDGTVAVWFVHLRDETTARYEAAYHFRNHAGYDAKGSRKGRERCHRAIEEMLRERGDIQPTAVDIPPLNTGLYHP